MVFVVSVHEILQDCTAFPDLQLATTLVRVDNSWNAAVGVYIEKPLFFLFVVEEIDFADLYEDCVGSPFSGFGEMSPGIIPCTPSRVPPARWKF